MRHRNVLHCVATRLVGTGLVAAGLLAPALPAAAEVYTIRLTSGGTFESRYQPKQAAWDATIVTFVDETGTEIALPQALVAEVTAQSETKGYGRVLDTTTVDLGFMPNDLDQSQQVMAQQAAMNANGLLGGAPTDVNQFLEPNAVGGGIPIGFTGGTNFNVPVTGVPSTVPGVPPGTTPAPFTQPTNTGTPQFTTPPPFTTPSPGTPTTTSPTSPQ